MLQTYDERNADIVYWVDGVLRHRDEPGISPFDSAVQGGDAVWEGLRLYDGAIFGLAAHLARLRRSAAALGFAAVPADADIIARDPGDAAGQRHARRRAHPADADPRREDHQRDGSAAQPGRLTLIVLAEHKAPVYETSGLRLVTGERTAPRRRTCLDPKIHHNNLLNSILAKMEANRSRRRRRADARRARLRRRDQRHPPVRGHRRHAGHAACGRLPGGDHPADRAATWPRQRGTGRGPGRVARRDVRAPTRCSAPARWARSPASSGSTAGRSATARRVR